MLSTPLVQEIARLLKLGELSQRQIATRLNISRGTVSAIASGQRGLYGKEPKNLRSPTTRSAAPARCPTCGHRVYLPCRFCRIREQQARKLLAEQLAEQLAGQRSKNAVTRDRQLKPNLASHRRVG